MCDGTDMIVGPNCRSRLGDCWSDDDVVAQRTNMTPADNLAHARAILREQRAAQLRDQQHSHPYPSLPTVAYLCSLTGIQNSGLFRPAVGRFGGGGHAELMAAHDCRHPALCE